MDTKLTQKEFDYLKSAKGRRASVATVSSSGQPDVAPVLYEFDGEHVIVGGHTLAQTIKYRNVKKNPKVAFAADDFDEAGGPRGIRLFGLADIVTRSGSRGTDEYIRIKPRRAISWGVNEPALRNGSQPVFHHVKFA